HSVPSGGPSRGRCCCWLIHGPYALSVGNGGTGRIDQGFQAIERAPGEIEIGEGAIPRTNPKREPRPGDFSVEASLALAYCLRFLRRRRQSEIPRAPFRGVIADANDTNHRGPHVHLDRDPRPWCR